MGRVVDVAGELLLNDRDVADGFAGFGGEFPFHGGGVLGNAAVDETVEVLDDLEAALGPVSGGFHFLAVVERQGIGKVWVGVGLRLIVVRGVLGFRIAAIRAGSGPCRF